VDLRIHPCKLETLCPLTEQAVVIYTDAEGCSFLVPLDDVEQPGQQNLESLTVVSRAYITIGGMEEPETRIGGVVKAGGLSFGKHIGNQAIAYVLRKAAENVFAFVGASCGEGEAFERDHCVTAPVGEPMVSSNDRADFIADTAG